MNFKLTKKKAVIFIIVIAIWLILLFAFSKKAIYYSQEKALLWRFQSIDTMKYSRDLAREKLNDPVFDLVIEEQISNIAKTGATHVGIATPYDEEFLPFLKRWLSAARKHNLSVWFRGNWSGWEKWFGYPAIDRAEHIKKTEYFILNNADLFKDGDVFSACPECENGGPGDPRRGDAEGFRRFIIEEYQVTKNAFAKINKKVESNYVSMNGDVARLVMDDATTTALDGIVTIDHYVPSSEKMISDIHEIAQKSGGKIVIGEFGAPVPDLHGNMTEEEQAMWVKKTLQLLAKSPDVIGVSYWTNVGGSTQLWNNDGSARLVVKEVSSIFNAPQIIGRIIDISGSPVSGAVVFHSPRVTISDKNGNFVLPFVEKGNTVVKAKGYKDQIIYTDGTDKILVELQPEYMSIWTHIQVLFRPILKRF